MEMERRAEVGVAGLGCGPTRDATLAVCANLGSWDLGTSGRKLNFVDVAFHSLAGRHSLNTVQSHASARCPLLPQLSDLSREQGGQRALA